MSALGGITGNAAANPSSLNVGSAPASMAGTSVNIAPSQSSARLMVRVTVRRQSSTRSCASGVSKASAADSILLRSVGENVTDTSSDLGLLGQTSYDVSLGSGRWILASFPPRPYAAPAANG